MVVKDWQDKEPHLLPAKHLSAWIQNNLYLSLRCTVQQRRQQGDQCLDAPCFHIKVNAHIDREMAAHPELVQIENGYRNPKEKRPGAVQRGHFREIEHTDNPDAEPLAACQAARAAIIVYGKRVGTTLTVCTDNNCPVHDPAQPYVRPNKSRRTLSPSSLPPPRRKPQKKPHSAKPNTSSAERSTRPKKNVEPKNAANSSSVNSRSTKPSRNGETSFASSGR